MLTAVALTGLTGASASASASGSYETITLAAGEQRRYAIGDGERFENVLIDQTADGSMFYIIVEEGANDWVIRNVGWKGVAPTGGGNRDGTFLINVRGDGLIENVFIDQRDHEGGGTGSDVGAIWTYSPSHHGHIDCRHNFIAGCGNNGSYDSGEGWSHNSGTGTVAHYRSYHRDNTPSNFRPGKPDDRIVECVSIANDPDGRRGTYPGSDSQLCRAVWAWHNPGITVENCAFWWDPDDVQPAPPFWATHRSGSEGSRCELTLVDCDINASWADDGNDLVGHGGSSSRIVNFDNLGTDPDISILGDGVPLTPEMAARGERALPPQLGTAPSGGHGRNEDTETVDEWSYENASGVYTDLPHELVLDHVEPGERVTYEVKFDGNVEAGEWEHNASVEDQLAVGGMGPERGLDNIYFDGEILRFEVEHEDHARFFIADAQRREILREVSPSQFPEESSESGSDDEGSTDESSGGNDAEGSDDDRGSESDHTSNEDGSNQYSEAADDGDGGDVQSDEAEASSDEESNRGEHEDDDQVEDSTAGTESVDDETNQSRRAETRRSGDDQQAVADDPPVEESSADDEPIQEQEDVAQVADAQPGFGVAAALASVGAVGFVLRRLLHEED